MRLTLIRHAQSVSNAGGRTQPHLGLPLTAHGHTQARTLGATLVGPASAVMVSRFLRAQQTVRPDCQRFNLEPRIDADLDEFSLLDAALTEGLDGAQRKPFVHAYWADPDLHRREDARVINTAGMRAFREFQWQLPMPNCAVFEVARHGSQPWRMARVSWRAKGEYAHG